MGKSRVDLFREAYLRDPQRVDDAFAEMKNQAQPATTGGAWEALDQEARDFVLFMVEDGDHGFPHDDGPEAARALRDRVQRALLRSP